MISATATVIAAIVFASTSLQSYLLWLITSRVFGRSAAKILQSPCATKTKQKKKKQTKTLEQMSPFRS